MNERISIDPNVQHGRPVIKGTRVPVSVILANLAGGESRDTIVREYGVTDADISAALAYAVEIVEQQRQRPLKTA